ncbi:hypothetical protein ABQE69_04630 [Mycolicibacillus trivialis]
MSLIGGAVRKATDTIGWAAGATTAAAGAVGGAVVSGAAGGVTGTVNGVRRGVRSGSHSTPAAALTLGALGASGLVAWPVVAAVGGGALVVQQLNRRSPQPATEPADEAPKLASVKTGTKPPAKKSSRPTPGRPARSRTTRR